jgi:hypothetical protein
MKTTLQIAGSTAMIVCGVVSCVAGGVLYWWSLFEKDRGDRLSSIKQLQSLAGTLQHFTGTISYFSNSGYVLL